MIRIKSKCNDDCTECTPRIIASFTTNPDTPVWDLTPYQGDGVGTPNRKWRLFERGAGLEYESGEIDANGQLVGLPDEFVSHFSYDGYMELQEGCIDHCCSELYNCTPDYWP